jgi:hypothetical protein
LLIRPALRARRRGAKYPANDQPADTSSNGGLSSFLAPFLASFMPPLPAPLMPLMPPFPAPFTSFTPRQQEGKRRRLRQSGLRHPIWPWGAGDMDAGRTAADTTPHKKAKQSQQRL